ncbi:MAG: hypothetical protein ACTSV3_00195 [Candidatus Thorarchaeota archaeon]|nr:MAG: hypothetical protein DRP09_05180 [Candidatus Thorarchaeota archaeon]
MSRSARGVPKEIALFGERQFKETGASAVEVLRVKASTIRKHFRELRGVNYIVAVISLDRIRVYFFTQAGLMVGAENLDLTTYSKVRKTSRLLAKYEKPRELTPEEKRIEATEEMRTALSGAIRRISRHLGIKAPAFPDVFVTREPSQESSQSFGATWSPSGEVVFNEDSLKTDWSKSLLDRVAFSLTLTPAVRMTDSASLIGNALSLSLQKGSKRFPWLRKWEEVSKESEWIHLVTHFIRHADTYRAQHYDWFRQTLIGGDGQTGLHDLAKAVEVIHDGCHLPIGTEEYHKIVTYCKALKSPRKLLQSHHEFDNIHLSPRVISLPDCLDITLGEVPEGERVWVQVRFMEGRETRSLTVAEGGDERIDLIEYMLNLEDIYPSSGGLFSHGRTIVRNALRALGVTADPEPTLDVSIEPSHSTLNTSEKAVLDRLVLGERDIILNSLVGSPQAVESLVKKGRVIFLPDFNHLGLNLSFVVHGDYTAVREVVRSHTLETTLLRAGDVAYALSVAPSQWSGSLVSAAASAGLSVMPVLDYISPRRTIRVEHIRLV